MNEIQEKNQFLQQENDNLTNLNRQIEQLKGCNDNLNKTQLSLYFNEEEEEINNRFFVYNDLASYTNLTYLVIVLDVNMKQNQLIGDIGVVLRNLVQLKIFSFCCSPSNSEAASKLGQGIAQLKDLQELYLVFEKNCMIGIDGAKDLCKGFKNLQQVFKMVLIIPESNNIGNKGSIYLLQGISQMISLSNLKLKLVYPSITSDNYKNKDETEEEVEEISFKNLLMLQRLNLTILVDQENPFVNCDNQRKILPQIDVCRLFQVMNHLRNVSSLQVNMNFSNGLPELGRSIASYNNLLDFKLSVNQFYFNNFSRISLDDTLEFGKGLSNLTKLQNLDMDLINLTVCGANEILSRMNKLKGLQSLKISLPQLELFGGAKKQKGMWSRISELTNLRMVAVELSLPQIVNFCDDLSKMSSLNHLDLEVYDPSYKDPKVSKEQLNSLMKSLKSIPNLFILKLYLDYFGSKQIILHAKKQLKYLVKFPKY